MTESNLVAKPKKPQIFEPGSPSRDSTDKGRQAGRRAKGTKYEKFQNWTKPRRPRSAAKIRLENRSSSAELGHLQAVDRSGHPGESQGSTFKNTCGAASVKYARIDIYEDQITSIKEGAALVARPLLR